MCLYAAHKIKHGHLFVAELYLFQLIGYRLLIYFVYFVLFGEGSCLVQLVTCFWLLFQLSSRTNISHISLCFWKLKPSIIGSPCVIMMLVATCKSVHFWLMVDSFWNEIRLFVHFPIFQMLLFLGSQMLQLANVAVFPVSCIINHVKLLHIIVNSELVSLTGIITIKIYLVKS